MLLIDQALLQLVDLLCATLVLLSVVRDKLGQAKITVCLICVLFQTVVSGIRCAADTSLLLSCGLVTISLRSFTPVNLIRASLLRGHVRLVLGRSTVIRPT